jgi:CDP-diacylglycerol--glycerol-3-phosphate 3-phosphatidyltransferase
VISDYLYAVLVAVLTLGGLAVYGVRVMRNGVATFDRTNATGGSPLLSKRLVEFGYWAILPLARLCVRAGIKADHVTWASLALGLVSGVAMAAGLVGLASLMALFSALGDILDGQVARLGKSGSRAGELLDSSLDRYTEFAFIGGMCVFYRHHPGFLAVALIALQGAAMVSYSSAKAEAMGVALPRAPMRRHERSVYLITGAALSSMLAPWLEPFPPFPTLQAPLMLGALLIVAIAANLSAIRRLVLIGRTVNGRDAGPR